VFSGIRHELGNPVNSATFALNMLLDNLGTIDETKVRGYLVRTLAELKKVSELLALLKSFEAFEACDVRPVELIGFLEALIARSRPDCERREVDVELECVDDETHVMADPRALHQALLNVLANALEACSDQGGGTIVIGAKREGRDVFVRVQDNGGGMSEERRGELFRPFVTSKAEHNGLGLAVCQRLMSKLGGAVDVETKLGKGTSVVMRLPAAEL